MPSMFSTILYTFASTFVYPSSAMPFTLTDIFTSPFNFIMTRPQDGALILVTRDTWFEVFPGDPVITRISGPWVNYVLSRLDPDARRHLLLAPEEGSGRSELCGTLDDLRLVLRLPEIKGLTDEHPIRAALSSLSLIERMGVGEHNLYV
ncbi:hypothetical protein AYL99_11775 [Fonsecaea erecta]|uniref:Uncharacterized protein n=1 Tax=Fonsecaea erecta TaxID=1367422 RepID=A0A178Z4J6_9EURO|nr:hypothetical protein AYL99_11775 [Fonsecaea erecta]OAP54015.1 hypothetical protein AYL99_11775 [Fonsecaea erecta]